MELTKAAALTADFITNLMENIELKLQPTQHTCILQTQEYTKVEACPLQG